MTEEEIKNTSFTCDIIHNIEFRGSKTDLKDIVYTADTTGNAIFTGKLPTNMGGGFQNLTINNAIIPIIHTQNQEEPTQEQLENFPLITEKLTIHNLTGAERIFQGWTKEDIIKFEHEHTIMPQYKCPENIYKNHVRRIYYPLSSSDYNKVRIQFTDENGNPIGPVLDYNYNPISSAKTNLLNQFNKGIYRG